MDGGSARPLARAEARRDASHEQRRGHESAGSGAGCRLAAARRRAGRRGAPAHRSRGHGPGSAARRHGSGSGDAGLMAALESLPALQELISSI
jgi:hypothetical protein